MEEIILQLLANAAFRATLEGIVVSVVAEVMHRRAVDPDFLSKSDAAFSVLSNAKTAEDRANAQKALSDLMASG